MLFVGKNYLSGHKRIGKHTKNKQNRLDTF